MAMIDNLIVADYGAFVGLKGRRIQVSIPDEKPISASIMHLHSVVIASRSVSISSAALSACCEAGIPIHFIDAIDGNYASVLSPKLTTVVTSRRCQMLAVDHPLGVEIARAIAVGKVQSQIVNLRYLARRLEGERAEKLKLAQLDLMDYKAHFETLDGTWVGDIRARLMGIEGRSSRTYWEAIGLLLPDSYGWTGRTGRHATDPINTLLNYGYGILYGEVQNALVIAGLEPYVGLIHTDRPGKPSLVLDFIEEFRAPIVDRTVVGLANRQFQVELDDNGRITRDCRRAYADRILSRLEAQGNYQGKRYQLRSIIQLQARLLASAFRDESPYTSYTGG